MRKYAAIAVIVTGVVIAGGALVALNASDKSSNEAVPQAQQQGAAAHNHAPAEAAKPANPAFAEATEKDIVFGDPNAKVTVTEYASLSCSHCADFHLKIFPEINTKYVETGKVKFVYRDFALNAPALKAAMMLRCLPKEKVKPALGTLYRTQNKWAFDKDFQMHLQQIALLMGLDKTAFEKCINDKAREDDVLKSRVDANKELAVTGTPSIFVDGERVLPTVEGLSQKIDAQLAK